MARILIPFISIAAIAMVSAVLCQSPARASALLWDWSYLGIDRSEQEGEFTTTFGNTADPNTIYTVTEFSVTRSDTGVLPMGAPRGSTNDGTYHAFAGVPMAFRYANDQFIFGPDFGLGGRFDTAYESPLGYYVYLFQNQPQSPPGPNLGEGYLYYYPPGGQAFDCCNNGTVTTHGPRAVPEPTTLVLCWVALAACCLCKGHAKRAACVSMLRVS